MIDSGSVCVCACRAEIMQPDNRMSVSVVLYQEEGESGEEDIRT